MNIIRCIVRGQRLAVNVPLMADLTLNYFNVEANFDSTWDDYPHRWIHIHKQGDATVGSDWLLDSENKVSSENGINLPAGSWDVWLHGSRSEGGEETSRITTVVKTFVIEPSGTDGGLMPDIPESNVEQITALAVAADERSRQAYDMAESVVERADSGEFDGPQGPTGPKGEDAPDDYILVQNEEPESETNKIWVKPDSSERILLATMEDVDIKAGRLVDNVSGAIASFVPDATIPNLLGVAVDIEPVQAGSGDPSPYNVRPIYGWDAVELGNTGVNLTISTDVPSSTNRYAAALYAEANLMPSTTYTISFVGMAGNRVYANENLFTYRQIDLNGERQSFTLTTVSTLSKSNINQYLQGKGWYIFKNNQNQPNQNVFDDVQIELGPTPSDYHPYAGNRYTIQLGQTVYGGSLDATNGTMTIDRAEITPVITALQSINSYGIANFMFEIVPRGVPNQDPRLEKAICNVLPVQITTIATTQTVGFNLANDGIGYLRLNASEITDVASANAWVSDNNCRIVYYLGTPITITLDPVTISTISGQTNNVWSSSGNVSVTFAADIKEYIDRMNQPTEDDMIANTLIATNKYFTINNKLYLSTASIAAGAQIIPGTNCTETSIAEALNALNT